MNDPTSQTGRDGMVVTIALAEVRRRLAEAVRIAAPLRLPLDAAEGLVAADDVIAGTPWPSANVALADGWAVASIETIGATPGAPAVVTTAPPVVADGVVPAGFDAVVPLHQGQAEAGFLLVETAATPGGNLRRRGADLPEGRPVVRSGAVFDTLALAAARLVGATQVTVRRPRLAIVARDEAGEEVAEFVGRACARLGAAVVPAGETCDLPTIAVGGAASRPPHEIFTPALVGAERVRLEIGAEGVVLRLPPRLEVAVVAVEALVAPMIDRSAGRTPEAPPPPRPLARKVASRVGLGELALLAITPDGHWTPIAVGELPLEAWLRAEGVLELPPQSEGSPEGTLVAAHPPRFLRR